MAKKNFKNLIDDDEEVTKESDNANTQVAKPVSSDHPIVGELLLIKDEEQRQKIVVDITNLIGGFEVGRVLLQEATKNIQAYTEAIRQACISLDTNITNANDTTERFSRQVEEAKHLKITINLGDGQKKWLEENRKMYLADTTKALEAHFKAIQELGNSQVMKFKDELAKSVPGSFISDRILIPTIAIFFLLAFGYMLTVVTNIAEVHSSTLSWILWIEGILIALVVGLAMYLKRK